MLASKSLNYGELVPLHVTEKQLVYARTYFDEITVAMFNKDREVATFDFELPARFADAGLNANFGSMVQVNGNTVTVTVPPNAFDVLTN